MVREISIQTPNEYVLEPTMHTELMGRLAGNFVRKGRSTTQSIKNSGRAAAAKAKSAGEAVKKAGQNAVQSVKDKIEKEKKDYYDALEKGGTEIPVPVKSASEANPFFIDLTVTDPSH